jgi:hypothetical protein
MLPSKHFLKTTGKFSPIIIPCKYGIINSIRKHVEAIDKKKAVG